MSGVPYTFGNATTSIPLSQLDVNFATNATLGNASVGLGNTTTTVGNLTVSNISIVSTNGDATIHGLTVGQGAGSISTNTALGSGALATNSTGSYVTAIGSSAGNGFTTGTSLTAIGANAAKNTTGNDNIAIGLNALITNTSGALNVAVGDYALNTNNANNNTAVGYQAGYNNTGSGNTYIGEYSGYNQTSGSNNTFIGNNSGNTSSNGAGSNNICIGAASGQYLQTGSNNVILGSYTGFAAPISVSGSNYVVLSDGAGNVRGFFDNSGNFYVGGTNGSAGVMAWIPAGNASGSPYSAAYSSSNSSSYTYHSMYYTGASQYQFYVDWGGTVHARSITISSLSDQRLKTNIKDISTGLTQILNLKPRNFDWLDGSKSNAAGFIAQEFQQVFPNSVSEFKEGEDGVKYLEMNHEELIPSMVKAIQELSAQVTALQETVTALQAKVGA